MFETRMIPEYHIWCLWMNLMFDRTESSQLVAIGSSREQLITWYESQFAPQRYTESMQSAFGPYDHTYYKTFKKGSPLENFNPIYNYDGLNEYGQGISNSWYPKHAIENEVRRNGIVMLDSL